jgi:hypothetical protein
LTMTVYLQSRMPNCIQIGFYVGNFQPKVFLD